MSKGDAFAATVVIGSILFVMGAANLWGGGGAAMAVASVTSPSR